MLPRLIRLLITAAGSLLCCVLLLAVLPATAASNSPAAEDQSRTILSPAAAPAVTYTLNLPLLSWTPPPPPPPTLTDLGTLGGPRSAALDVNNRGQVVGSSTLSADDGWGDGHAFLWQDGKMQDLGALGGAHSTAIRINDRGQVAGSGEFGPGTERHAFFWANGRMTDIGTLGGIESSAVELNELGQVAGASTNGAGDPRCFLWASGVMTDLGTLGGKSCYVRDSNDRGQIVGSSTITTGGEYAYIAHAFLWQNGVMTDLTPEFAPDQWSAAQAIDEQGRIIGFRFCPSERSVQGCATLWDHGVVVDLSYGGTGFDFFDASDDRGRIAGYGNYKFYGFPYGYTWDALLWQNGVLQNLGIQRGRFPNRPTLLDNQGRVVVDDHGQPALWHAGTRVPFPLPTDAGAAYVNALNDTGLAAGEGNHALLWQFAPAKD